MARLALLVALCLGYASAVGRGPSPVSRVAELLTNLASKIDSELDAETDLYESYVCWAKTVITSKTASNEKAQSRKDSLETYLADLSAGRIELTTERSDLEKEVNTLNGDLEKAKNLRDQENTDYKAATDEMAKGIKSLDAAIKVLDEATAGSKASLMNLRSRISQTALIGESEGFSTRVEEADQLEKAVSVSSKYLKSGDALFLQRLLSGEVPQKDWNKLNRKAGFKMKYKARSVKIQDTLAKLLQNFKDNKEEAETKEKDAKTTYDKLKKAKEGQLKASTDALTKGDVENGAAGVSKSDAKAEIKALDTQITDDKKYIGETEDALADKKKEFVTRKGLRVGEIAAINKAIGVIHSDDARDLFKRSITFVQISSHTSTAAQMASAAVQRAARVTGDLRLNALAARIGLNSGGKFTKVISSIDKMIAELEQDGKDDTANKKECEDDRAADTKEAADLSRDMDELSDDISKLEGEIEQIDKEVAEKEKSVEDTEKEIKDADTLRAKENAEWKVNDADDSAAAKLLDQAAGVLKTFYKDNFSLVQKKTANDAPTHTTGEAPPPPPKTWGGDYGGAQKEQTGIVGILELIKKDVETDQKSAKSSEDTAQTNHDKFVKESNASIKKLKEDINKKNEEKATKEKSIGTKKETSATKKGSLDTVVKKMKAAQPGCDFLLVNFKTRTENRKLESDGLKEAKKILKEQDKL